MIWHSSPKDEVISAFGTDEKRGLSTDEVEEKLKNEGPNLVIPPEKTSVLHMISERISHFHHILFLLAVTAMFVIYLVYDPSRWYLPVLAVLVLALQIAVDIITVIQSQKIVNRLRNRVTPKVHVLRNGVIRRLDASTVVTGDILVLEPGEYIAADARLIETNDFRCDEEFVTGEKVPVQKDADALLDDIDSVSKRINMVYCGSSVVSGSARAIVTETGPNTKIGRESGVLREFDSVDIRLKERMSAIGRISGVTLLIGCLVLFFLYVLLNLHNGQNFALLLAEAITNSISLLICVLPEGLPIVAGLAFSISVLQLLQYNIIIKNMEAFDKLTQLSVICADKTGILTCNTMELTELFTFEGPIAPDDVANHPLAMAMLRAASLCTNQTPDDRDSLMYRDPTEMAIIRCCMGAINDTPDDFFSRYPRLCKIPFNSERKIMTSVNMIDGRPYAIVKGAPDLLLSMCRPMDYEAIHTQIKQYASNGMRVIAAAYKPLDEIPANPTSEELENNLIFMGVMALTDPIQANIVDQIEACRRNGIRIVMVTGDHVETARSLARRLGILTDDTDVLTGEALAELSDQELTECIHQYAVFARISPNDKLRIVRALQNNAEKVAITGDSVHDAPALSVADVGIAMGTTGTDVARGAADVILNDNHFHSIIRSATVSARLFVALKRTVTYLLSSNIGEFMAVFFSILLFKRFPMTAAALLLLNLITDSFPVFTLLFDHINGERRLTPAQPGVKKFFTLRSVVTISVQALVLSVLSLSAASLCQDTSTQSTLIFTVLAAGQLFNMLTVKTKRFLWQASHLIHRYSLISTGLAVLLIILLILTPVGGLFGLSPLSFDLFVKATLLSALVAVSGELCKLGFYLFKRFSKVNMK